MRRKDGFVDVYDGSAIVSKVLRKSRHLSLRDNKQYIIRLNNEENLAGAESLRLRFPANTSSALRRILLVTSETRGALV